MDTFDLSAFFVSKGEIMTHNQQTQAIMQQIRQEHPQQYTEKMVLHLALKQQELELNQKINSVLAGTK